MTPEQFERTKKQLLLLRDLVNQTPLEELIDVVEALEKMPAQEEGDDMLLFLAKAFSDIRAMLPAPRLQKAPKEKRTTKVRLNVRGRLDGAGGDQNGTMTIDPTLGTISVRPEKKQSVYTRSVREIADFICRSTILGKR